MKDLILGFKLLRYGYKLKTNVMMLILFTAIGFVQKRLWKTSRQQNHTSLTTL